MLQSFKSFKPSPPFDGSGQAFLSRVYAGEDEGGDPVVAIGRSKVQRKMLQPSRGQVPNARKGVKRFFATWICHINSIWRLRGLLVNDSSELAFCSVRERLFEKLISLKRRNP